MALEQSKYQRFAATALRLIQERGRDVILKRPDKSLAGQNENPTSAEIPVVYSGIVFDRGVGDSLQRFDDEISGDNIAYFAIKSIAPSFKGLAEGFVFSDGAAVAFSDGRLVEAKSPSPPAPYISVDDFFVFGDNSHVIKSVGATNPDGEYPILFTCLVS